MVLFPLATECYTRDSGFADLSREFGAGRRKQGGER